MIDLRKSKIREKSDSIQIDVYQNQPTEMNKVLTTAHI